MLVPECDLQNHANFEAVRSERIAKEMSPSPAFVRAVGSLSVALASLLSAPAADSLRIGAECNQSVCVGGEPTCDEATINLVCNFVCPAWVVGVCWSDLGRPPCDSNEMKFVCYTEPE
jgi:hypothetical protein